MPAAAADDDDQLGLVIDLLADPGQDDRVAVADQGGRILAEEDRLGRDRHAALGGVVAVVQADADDLARVGDRRQEPGLGRVVASRSRGRRADQASRWPFRPSGQQLSHARGQLGIGPVHSRHILPSNTPQALGPWSVATVTQRTVLLLVGWMPVGRSRVRPVVPRTADLPSHSVYRKAAQSEHQPGGVAVEVERRAGVPAKGRGRASFADRSAQGGQDGVGLARAGDDHRDDGAFSRAGIVSV